MFALASLAVLALAVGARADLVISTPESLTVCQDATYYISGDTPGPYSAFIVRQDDPCGDALKEIEDITGDSFTWTVDLPAGTQVMVALEADSGEAWSGALTIGEGDASCIAGNSPAAPPPSTTSTTSTTSATSTTYTSSSRSSTIRNTLTAPANVASGSPSLGLDTLSGGGSRVAIGVSSVVTLVGAAVAAFAL